MNLSAFVKIISCNFALLYKLQDYLMLNRLIYITLNNSVPLVFIFEVKNDKHESSLQTSSTRIVFEIVIIVLIKSKLEQ